MTIPNALLNRLYTIGSLRNADGGPQFALKNRLSDAELIGLRSLAIDGQSLPLDHIRLDLQDGRVFTGDQVSPAQPLPFPLRSVVTVHADGAPLPGSEHRIEMAFETRPFGKLKLTVVDAIAENRRRSVPRDETDDYTPDIVARRRALIEEAAGIQLKHLVHHSFDPHIAKGNCENFVGVAQVPVGLAGPLLIDGEHARGEFFIPLATSEGTLVASYGRGMKVLSLSGGVRTTVVADAMQRAPVFVFNDARAGREFVEWIDENLPEIRREAEKTSSVAKLDYIDPYLANKFVYLRFNFATGDAAGQNMVGRATYAACNWILEHASGVTHFYLESNFATDKKASRINMLRTRGKRVTAEATIPAGVLKQHLRVEAEQVAHHYGVANVGAFLSGANNNGAQSANGITAMFIATGQDIANVAESSAGILYAEVTPDRGLYLSLTLPSLIVATHGGGTGLPTQRECLSILGCTGRGTVRKLAEIVAGVALAGEVSLASAISSQEWVSSHEQYGRNR
jgi:hydroxymethylglutaryl-CoA reductase (NADPH)